MISLLAHYILAGVHIEVPWEAIRALPEDVVQAVTTGDTAPLRSHVAQAFDDAVDLSGIKGIGPALEEGQSELAHDLVEGASAIVADEIRSGTLTATPGATFAAALVDTPEEARLVLARKAFWKATHRPLVKAAEAVLAQAGT